MPLPLDRGPPLAKSGNLGSIPSRGTTTKSGTADHQQVAAAPTRSGIVTNHSGTFNYTISGNAPPVVAELKAVFHQLPDDYLISQLRGPTRRGPKGHDPRILWRCYITYYYLGLESISTLIRLLHDNPFVAKACGIDSPDQIPSQPTFSRFGTRLARKAGEFILAIKNILRGLTRKLYDTFPGFGRSVAIDSTDIKAWSNAGKKGKKRKEGKTRQKPLLWESL